jgi:hypothetical protein
MFNLETARRRPLAPLGERRDHRRRFHKPARAGWGVIPEREHP